MASGASTFDIEASAAAMAAAAASLGVAADPKEVEASRRASSLASRLPAREEEAQVKATLRALEELGGLLGESRDSSRDPPRKEEVASHAGEAETIAVDDVFGDWEEEDEAGAKQDVDAEESDDISRLEELFEQEQLAKEAEGDDVFVVSEDQCEEEGPQRADEGAEPPWEWESHWQSRELQWQALVPVVHL